jgi:hypothetical protein
LSAAGTLYLGDGLLSAGKAYDVTMTFDASEQLLSGYIHDWEGNLVVYSNKTVSHTGHSNSDVLEIGARQGGTPDNGGIELVALWDRVLSSNEVSLLSTLPVDQGPAEYVYEFNTAAPTNNTGTAGSGADLAWNGGGLGSAGFYQTDGGGNEFTDADVYNQVGNDTWGLYCDGSGGDYLKATSGTVADFSGDFTIFIRHYRRDGEPFLVRKGVNSANPGYALQRQAAEYVLYSFPYSEDNTLRLGNGLLSAGKAYDVTMMFDASKTLLSGYIYDWTGNLVVYSNKTVGNLGLSNSDSLLIGSNQGGTPDNGGIERVSIWDRLLSSNEVFRLSNPPKGTLICIQ